MKEKPVVDDCLFCQMVKGKIPVKRLHEDEQTIAFDDINPQAKVHMLVIPKRHVVSLDHAQEADAALLGQLVLVCGKMARERGVAESGYRVVVNSGRGAGQSVFHVHFHVLGGRSFGWPPG
jgi:histidine triad (HIT) family protein